MPRTALQSVDDDHMPTPNYEDQRADAMREQAAAMREQAAALNRIADMGEHIVAAFGPAAKAIADLGDAQKRFCEFLVKRRLSLVGGTVTLLVTIGAVSPNAAAIIGKILHAYGVG